MGRGGGDGKGAKLEGSQRNSTPASGGAMLRLVVGGVGFLSLGPFSPVLTLSLYVAYTVPPNTESIPIPD